MSDVLFFNAWVTGISSVMAAGLSAGLTHMYRNNREKAVVSVTIDEFKRSRAPIAMPKDIFNIIKKEGGFREYLKPIVRWDPSKKFNKNEFTLSELRELLHLSPEYITKCQTEVDEFKSYIDSFSKPQYPPSDEQAYILALLRGYWHQSFKEDIFISYSKDSNDVAEKIKNNLEGDIHGRQIAVNSLTLLNNWLSKGLSADAQNNEKIVPGIKSPKNPQIPFINISLLVRNSGKSETLIKDSASLIINDNVIIPIKSYSEEQGFSVYNGKFWRIKPTSIVSCDFSQDPYLTNMAQLQSLRDLIEDRRHLAYIEIEDYSGMKIRTNQFTIKDIAD